MSTITNVRVLYKRTVQPREYESKTAEVEYNISFDDGDEKDVPGDIVDDMLEEAKDQVLKALGVRKKEKG